MARDTLSHHCSYCRFGVADVGTIRRVTMTNERGSTLLMVIFAVCLCAAVLLGTAAAASLYATQKKVYMLADGAALAACQSFDLASVRANGTHLAHTLTDANVHAAVTAFLAHAPGSRGIQAVTARAVAETTAEVTLRVLWQPPVVSMFFPRGIPLEVTARAEGVFT